MKVQVEVVDCRGYSLPSSLEEFAMWLHSKIASIPPECMPEATIRIDTDESYGESYANIYISYDREETEEEAKDRFNREAQESYANMARELETLDRLKRKYETK